MQFIFVVSHTTDDLIFQWLPLDKTPLAVDDGIQLPQLELINNKTGDCTSVYSTGIWYIFARLLNKLIGPKYDLIRIQHISRKLHLFGSHIQVQATSWLLSLPYLYSNMFDCHDVLDLILDQTGSSPCEGHIRSNQLTYIINATRK